MIFFWIIVFQILQLQFFVKSYIFVKAIETAWQFSSAFIINFEHVSHIVLMFWLLILKKYRLIGSQLKLKSTVKYLLLKVF